MQPVALAEPVTLEQRLQYIDRQRAALAKQAVAAEVNYGTDSPEATAARAALDVLEETRRQTAAQSLVFDGAEGETIFA